MRLTATLPKKSSERSSSWTTPPTLLLRTDYVYRDDGLLAEVQLGSGGKRKLVHDGYGTLYEVTALDASESQSVLAAKYFIDAELEVVNAFRGSPAMQLWTKLSR